MKSYFWTGFEKEAVLGTILKPFKELGTHWGSQGKIVADKGSEAAAKLLEASKNTRATAETIKNLAHDAKSLKAKELVVPALAASALLGFGAHVGKRVASIGERDGR